MPRAAMTPRPVLTAAPLSLRIALLVPVGVYVFRNAEEGDAPPS